MYVLLDMHGAPGCQSDQFHTGKKDFNQLFENPGQENVYRTQTVALWEEIANHYKDHPGIMGYDLLNEPTGVDELALPKEVLWDFYDVLYTAIRNIDPNHLIVMEGTWEWDSLPEPDSENWQNVIYQFHFYHWGHDFDLSAHEQYIDNAVAQANLYQNTHNYQVPVMIGEFHGFGLRSIWEYYLENFNDMGWSWTLWSYKVKDHNSAWGLYNHDHYNDSLPNFNNDSYEVLSEKLSKFDTLTTFEPNVALIDMIIPYINEPYDNDLLTYYSFNQDCGNIIPDESHFGYHGNIMGTPVFVEEGIKGGAYDYAKYDYILAQDNPLAGGDNFTISLWFKTPDPTQNYKIASGAYWYGGNNASGWIIGTHYPEAWGDNQIGGFRGEPEWTRTHTFVPGEWNNLVVTYDGDNVKEYINGEVACSVLGTGVSIGIGRPLEVGSWSQYSGMNYVGLIDEFQIFNRAISLKEVQELGGFQTQEPVEKLLVYYSFDQDEQNTIQDQSGCDNNGQIIGTPTFTPQGIIGGAYDFKHADYILAQDNPLEGAEKFSVSLWFKTPDPTQNYKIASGAYWYGGNNASGWIIGTHYPEAWGDNQVGGFRGEPGWTRSHTFLPGQWNHLVVSYDGLRVKEYINGQVSCDVLGTGVSIGTGRTMEVGAWSQYSGMNYAGLIDEFRVYNYALDEEDILTLYENAQGGGEGGNEDEGGINNPPHAMIYGNTIYELESEEGSLIELSGSYSYDSDEGDQIETWEWTGPFGTIEGETLNVVLPVGNHEIGLKVYDGELHSEIETIMITVEDTTPPEITIYSPENKTYAFNRLNRTLTINYEGKDFAGIMEERVTLNGNSINNGETISLRSLLRNKKNILIVSMKDN
ncbi:hypothetical protein BVX93_01780, partial [bacterium B13(2017)]